jgi:hypothetical protein
MNIGALQRGIQDLICGVRRVRVRGIYV